MERGTVEVVSHNAKAGARAYSPMERVEVVLHEAKAEEEEAGCTCVEEQ